MCETYINIQTNEKLNLEKVKTLKDNALLKHRPDLWREWDFEKNNELGFDIWKLTYGSTKEVWWLKDCGHGWNASIKRRSRGEKCPYCVGKRVNETNCLATVNQPLAEEWHPTLNKELTPHDVFYGYTKDVWWLGKCGHEWDDSVSKRHHNNKGCPYCANYSSNILVGFNDMWTTNPTQASWLLNAEDGYKYKECSNTPLDWKCPHCDFEIKNKQPNTVKTQGLNCSRCSSKKSMGEKIMSTLLNKLGLEFVQDKQLTWSEDKRYDFYVPSMNLIIECHGEQHYEESRLMRRRTLAEEQENDQYKYDLALLNGVEPHDYIVINCSRTSFDFIKSSIMNSELINVFNLSDFNWKIVKETYNNPVIKHVCEDYKNGMKAKKLIEKYNIGKSTVYNYINIGKELGWV